jgi:hypothetical protein
MMADRIIPPKRCPTIPKTIANNPHLFKNHHSRFAASRNCPRSRSEGRNSSSSTRYVRFPLSPSKSPHTNLISSTVPPSKCLTNEMNSPITILLSIVDVQFFPAVNGRPMTIRQQNHPNVVDRDKSPSAYSSNAQPASFVWGTRTRSDLPQTILPEKADLSD